MMQSLLITYLDVNIMFITRPLSLMMTMKKMKNNLLNKNLMCQPTLNFSFV